MCVELQLSAWSLPHQWNRCCCHCGKKYVYHIVHSANFKPYNAVNQWKNTKLIEDYHKLSQCKYNDYITHSSGNCSCITNVFRHLLFFFYLLLFFPFMLLIFLILFIIYCIKSIYQLIIGYISFHCCCINRNAHETILRKMDDWSFTTQQASSIDQKRYNCYRAPMYLKSLVFQCYILYCEYLAGLFTAKLITDEMVIYWVHLLSTTRSKFVYVYDEETKQAISIRGIIDDYSSWCNNKSVSEMWQFTSFEIESVFIDYEDDCRITFNLRNGEKIIQPRWYDVKSPSAIDTVNNHSHHFTQSQMDEMRIWNIVKAHYQCLMSIYPVITSTYSQFHLHDLTAKYIQMHVNPTKEDKSTVFNRIIGSHTYYTSAVNAAHNHSDFCNVQTDGQNLCQFICAPWKVLPANRESIQRHYAASVTDHYFVDLQTLHKEQRRVLHDANQLRHMTHDESIALDSILNEQKHYLSKYVHHYGLKFAANISEADEAKDVEQDVHNEQKSIEWVIQQKQRKYLSHHTHHYDLKFEHQHASQKQQRANSMDADNVQSNETEAESFRYRFNSEPTKPIEAGNLSSILLPNKVDLNRDDIKISKEMDEKHFLDPTHNTPNIPHDIEVVYKSDAIDSPSAAAPNISFKVANPYAFPPRFVRCRLELFRFDFAAGSKWIEMHRNYCIYKDFLADYYHVVYEQFVVPLIRNNFIQNKEVETWILFLENNGFQGIVACKHNGEYLHVFATLLWLNIVHSANRIISHNVVRLFGVGSSYVEFKPLDWYKTHNNYNFVDVLQGKSFSERCRLQFYAMKNRLYWETFGATKDSICCVADHFIDSNLYKRFVNCDDLDAQKRHQLNKIHDDFVQSLKELDVKYRWLVPLEDICSGVSY